MLEKIKTELQEIYLFVKNNYQEIIVICSVMLFLSLKKYIHLKPALLNDVLYYFILPVLTIIILLRKNPLDFGLRLGNYRIWGLHVLVAVLIAIPVLIIASGGKSIQGFYKVKDLNMLEYLVVYTIKLFAWEFLFRGFLLFGLKDKLKETSIIVQMIPFVLRHFGKPMVETLACIPMGLYFGFVAYRGGSFLPAFIIHLFINILLKFFVNFG